MPDSVTRAFTVDLRVCLVALLLYSGWSIAWLLFGLIDPRSVDGYILGALIGVIMIARRSDRQFVAHLIATPVWFSLALLRVALFPLPDPPSGVFNAAQLWWIAGLLYHCGLAYSSLWIVSKVLVAVTHERRAAESAAQVIDR